MSTKKKEVTYKAVLSVTITTLISGFLLSFVFSSFEDDILANNERTVLNGVREVISEAEYIEGPLMDNSVYPYYIGKKNDGTIIGYAILSYANGYNGQNKILVGFNSNISRITGIFVTEQSETPGLGAKMVDPYFRNQFTNRIAAIDFIVVKGIKPEETLDNEIAAISGATISSTSVVNAVNSAKDEALNLFIN